MLYSDRIYVSEGIDPTKSNKNIKCTICYDWFFNHGFKLQDSLCYVMI